MEPSLKDYRNRALDAILAFLWDQWSALGVPGYAESEPSRAIDPEALLAFSIVMARYDARLFDGETELSLVA